LLPYNFQLQPNIVKILDNPPIANNDELWQTSLKIEPRGANRDDIIPKTFKRSNEAKDARGTTRGKSLLRSGNLSDKLGSLTKRNRSVSDKN
jgi:hypothetical protein